MKKFVLILFFLAGLYAALDQPVPFVEPGSTPSITTAQPSDSTPSSKPDEQWRSGQQVSGSGTVSRVLSDDNDGSRHQRFILRLSSGQTVLIAHNIDLAPRVSSVREGDTVSFYGEYEPNTQGGVIHWTHKDPQGRHADGWLEHAGRRYQ